MATAKETGDTVGVDVKPAAGDVGDASSTEVDLRNAPEEEQIAANVDLEKRAGTHEGDARDDEDNIVFWSEDDPQNPYNWPTWLKVLNCTLVSSLTFLTPLGSCKPACQTKSLYIQVCNLTGGRSHVRTRCHGSHDRIQSDEHDPCLLLRQCLRVGLRCRPIDICSAV
jgi:hypothetical protein